MLNIQQGTLNTKQISHARTQLRLLSPTVFFGTDWLSIFKNKLIVVASLFPSRILIKLQK